MPAKTASRRSAPAKKESSVVEIVVRRGAARRFGALKSQTSELPVVVTWDRRKADRRAKSKTSMDVSGERRATDRRQKAPFPWELADFLVVCPTPSRAAARKGKAKKD